MLLLLISVKRWARNKIIRSSSDREQYSFPAIWRRSRSTSSGIRLTISRITVVLFKSKALDTTGPIHCCSWQAWIILGKPDPALSPKPIIRNIVCILGFRGSLWPPAKSCSTDILRQPGLENKNESLCLIIVIVCVAEWSAWIKVLATASLIALWTEVSPVLIAFSSNLNGTSKSITRRLYIL